MGDPDALDSEYENGIADVLSYLAKDSAVVERNVRLPGRRSGALRQVDVVCRGRIFGMADAVMAVDCKRWKTPLDVADVGAFLDLVEDVAADVGLLVTNKGASPAALRRAREARAVRVEVLSIEDLSAWRPRGTVIVEYSIPSEALANATRSLRRAGYRVATATTEPRRDGDMVISAFRHWGSATASLESQRRHKEEVEGALRAAGVAEPIHVSLALPLQGGTPAHRWLEVTLRGHPIGLKILADDDAEARRQLTFVREHLNYLSPSGVPGESLGYLKPEDWPVSQMFGASAAR